MRKMVTSPANFQYVYCAPSVLLLCTLCVQISHKVQIMPPERFRKRENKQQQAKSIILTTTPENPKKQLLPRS